MSAMLKQYFTIVSVIECSLNSPPDWKRGVSVNWFLGRGSWEMESGVEWQESVECPLMELMGTPGGDRDSIPCAI